MTNHMSTATRRISGPASMAGRTPGSGVARAPPAMRGGGDGVREEEAGMEAGAACAPQPTTVCGGVVEGALTPIARVFYSPVVASVGEKAATGITCGVEQGGCWRRIEQHRGTRKRCKNEQEFSYHRTAAWPHRHLALPSPLGSMISAKLPSPPLVPPSPRLRGRRISPTAAPCLPDTGPSDHEHAGQPGPEEDAAAAAVSTTLRSPAQRASSQLSRWSRARALRSGRRLEWPATIRGSAALSVPTKSPPSSEEEAAAKEVATEEDGDGEEVVGIGTEPAGNSIYMVSDGTGWTVEHSVNAALGQFEHCLVDRGCATNTHLFSGIDDMDNLIEIVKQAAKEGALLLYTLADPSMAEATKKACDLWGVPSTDVLRPTIEAIASHIGVAPSGIPRSSASRKGQLTEDYFRRIEAIDFTIKQDDGAQPQNLARTHIVLVGVSRTGC